MSVRMIIVMCISLYTTRVTLKVLGVEDYGIYNVVCGFVAMFAFLNTSMKNGIQRFFNYEYGRNGEEGANNVYKTALIIQLLLAVIIIILTESVGIWFLNNKLVIPETRMVAAKWIFQFSIVSFLFVIMKAPFDAAVMAHERMDFIAIMSVIESILKLIIIVVLPYASADKLVLYGFLFLTITMLDFTAVFIYCKKNFQEIHLSKGEKRNTSLFKPMLEFSGWNLFGSFSNMMRDQGINIIMNLFFGPVINAARGIAMYVNSAVNQLVSNVLTPVRPQVIQSYSRGEMDRVMRLTFTISKFSLFFLFMLIVPLCIELRFVLTTWLGTDYPEHTEAFVVIILLTTSILIPMAAQATLVHASGKMRNYQVIGSIVKVLSVPIAYFLMKLGYAPEWALIMVLLFDAIGLFVGMLIIRTLMPFSIRKYTTKVIVPVLPVVSAAAICAWGVHSIIPNEILRFFLVCIVSTLVSLSVIYCFCLSKEEKMLIASYVEKINSRIKKCK